MLLAEETARIDCHNILFIFRFKGVIFSKCSITFFINPKVKTLKYSNTLFTDDDTRMSLKEIHVQIQFSIDILK